MPRLESISQHRRIQSPTPSVAKNLQRFPVDRSSAAGRMNGTTTRTPSMNLPNPFRAMKVRASLACALMAAGALLCPVPNFAAAATLPATPVGELGAQLIRHINNDNPAQMQ